MLSRPRRVRMRARPDDEEKSDQMVFAVCWSSGDNFSSRYEEVKCKLRSPGRGSYG